MSPIKVAMIDFKGLVPPRPANVAYARSMSVKTSGGPNANANSASGGAKRVKRMIETVPPMKELTAAATNAWGACPFLARGYPSNVVATAVEAPGMFRVIELMAPPYMAP